jgi:hypothetical protein
VVEDVLQSEPAPQCSAKGCRAAASWRLEWNNPRLHTPDRRKTWLACGDHRGSLGDFLTARGFLREVRPFDAPSGTALIHGDELT